MAIAGKVAPTYAGEWSDILQYQQHVYVRYNGDCYISIKPSVGISPTNKEYWFLALKNVTKEQIDNIVNGTTTVGNADTLGGLTAEEFVCNENLLVNPDFKINTKGLTKYEPSSGYLETVDKWEIANEVMYGGTAEVVENGIKLTNVKSGSTTYLTQFLYPTDEFKSQLNKRIFTLSAEIDDVVYSLTSGTACGVYSRVIPDGKIFFYKNNNGDKFDFAVRIDTMNGTSKVIKWVKLELGSVATPFAPPNPEVEKLKCGVAPYLPLTGGTINGFVDIASEYGIANTVTNDDTNKTYTFMFKANKSGECTIYLFDKSANKTLNAIWLSKEGGLYHIGYDGVSWNTILDTGNSKPVAIQETAPSDTSALWVDTANKVSKIYKDGAWTALA